MSRTFTPDIELIDQLMQDDTVAFEELYRRYWYSLYSYSYSKLQSHQRSKEIVKNIFVTLWSERQELPVEFSLNTYLYAELRKAVLLALTEQLVDDDAVPQLKEFDVDQLQKARVPVRTNYDAPYVVQHIKAVKPKQTLQQSIGHYVSFFTFHQWKKALNSMMNF